MAIQQPNTKAGGSGTSSGTSSASTRANGWEVLTRYVQETITELKKTTWPTKQEATRLTMVVIGVIVVMGVYMGTLDAVFSFLVNRFSLLK